MSSCAACKHDEQIVLNERMRDQEWAAQSTQILGFLPKLERSVVEMEKEKRGYLLTGDPAFVEAYKRATAAFYTLSRLPLDSGRELAGASRTADRNPLRPRSLDRHVRGSRH